MTMRLFHSWKKQLFSKPHCRRNYHYSAETLEQRQLLAVFTVTNNLDAGSGSLRQAILDANKTVAPDVVEFRVDGEVNSRGYHHVHLESALPTISRQLTIDGTTQVAYDGSAGFEIHGKLAGQANGFYVNAANSVIRGLSIWDFDSAGVWIAAPNVTVENCLLWENQDGIRAARTADVTIRNNEMHTNWYAGIHMLYGVNRATVENNEVHGNLHGITMYAGVNDAIVNMNHVYGNAQRGVNVTSSNTINNKITNNLVENNGMEGIINATSASFNLIDSNVVRGNGYSGITVAGGQVQGIVVSHNTVILNRYGIALSAQNVLVSENTIDSNQEGIRVVAGNYNKINSNVVSNNLGYGVYTAGLYNTGTGNVFVNNVKGNWLGGKNFPGNDIQ